MDNEKIKELYLATKIDQRLIIERNKRNLSRGQMAEKCGVSTYTYGKWEKGDSIPEPEKIIELFKLLNLDIRDFLSQRHNVILDVRTLIQKELYEIRNRKYELQNMLQNYESEEKDMLKMLNEDCSFSTEFEDIELEESFEGEGRWVSPKWIYFKKGLYIFKLEHRNEVEKHVSTRIRIFDVEGDSTSIMSLDEGDKEEVKPVTIKKDGYFLISVETRSAVKWSLKFTNDLFGWNDSLN
ncbi:helix-turn-helix domain-containing protein [Lysinibacillus sp. 54212]|uniref:helix-turn-helix domain-containing protein n=1 Tax=Lysinibacillus sp. 54212 TaxID=3119829 RepID=UPI002FCB0069